MTGINRRQFISASIAGLLCAGVYANTNTAAPRSPRFLSASDNNQGQHFISSWSLDGAQHFMLPVSRRAHDSCCSPDGQRAVFFARRPGTQAYVVDLLSGSLLHTINAQKNYHFFGHGLFSADGRYLFASENAFAEPKLQHSGIVAVYDAQTFTRLHEFRSGGIGPHQLAFMIDGHTLAVANGGILTHPDSERENLNLDTMQPSLAYIDSRNGQLLDQFAPAQHQMSIRHLAVTAQNQVVIGIQYEGDKTQQWPLLLTHRGETTLQALHADEEQWAAQNHYIASVAINSDGTLALSTSPRGGSAALWDLTEQRCLLTLPIRDVAGAAYLVSENQFLISNGLGQLLTIAADRGALFTTAHFSKRNMQWDNHLTAV